MIETVLSKDVILMSPITKPALLRQVFGLCLAHPAEIMSYQKMIGQLQNSGNTTTIASYLKLLSNAFILVPLEKYSGSKIRQRGSIPKVLVLDNAIISATTGQGFKSTLKDKIFWGRMVENAVGDKLYSILQDIGGQLFYWRDRNIEVDYILQIGQRLIAIEVKSGLPSKSSSGLELFSRRYKNVKKIVISQPESIKEITVGKKVRYVDIQNFFSNPCKSILDTSQKAECK